VKLVIVLFYMADAGTDLKFNITGLNVILFFIGSHGRTKF
jgi:hypothetical protein